MGDALDEKGEISVLRIQRQGVEFTYQGEVFVRERESSGSGGTRPATPKPSAGKPGPAKPASAGVHLLEATPKAAAPR